MEKRMWTRRILGILLIVGGFLFGAGRGPAGVCPGDRIFSALGLPVWSQGTTGTHYPGLAGLAAAIAGIVVINTTLGEKARIRVWTIVVVILVLDMVRAALG